MAVTQSDNLQNQGNDQPKFYIETYGCQMNVSDSEIVVSLMKNEGYEITGDIHEAGVIFINTCSIRDNAEQRVWGRLDVFRQEKKKRPGTIVGVIGCMAERLKEQLLEEKNVDMVIGPDAYRDLPRLLAIAETGQKTINTLLSLEETYSGISPVRYSGNGISAYVSIMRGCNYARSRDPGSILNEVSELVNNGYREVTLLGQNVDKYSWEDSFGKMNFAALLETVAKTATGLRVRFSTSYPSDITDEVLYAMASYPNICKSIHLPVQSGSSAVLRNMKRHYTREIYMNRVEAIRHIIPEASISTDIIAGFCGETAEDHQATLSLMEWAKYDFAYMFRYSERPGTYAGKRLKDDVPDDVKSQRLTEIIELQNRLSEESKKADLDKVFEVLVEGTSRKSVSELFGRTSQNKVVVFPGHNCKPGDYVNVRITACTSATLIGETMG
ncbi:MAG: tRNA (N6-isopentenyl adenosine(37)-C2)-methylthiotransferase MiaB [Bacteroidia bacterium]|nr:tRNA (N6-isopentenyl adenosine(37)-C2)-methylthiotransferase MiaB [Bacteroidia bacterium]